MSDGLLPELPDGSFRRVLCVAAHPDDLEYGTSAAVARWTSAGTEVVYLMLTRGEAGIDSSPPERTALVRMDEERAGAQAVGVDRVDFLDHPDGMLEYGPRIRHDIARVIREVKPDAVVVASWDVELSHGLNQADHRVAGLATLDAVRDAGNRWVFTGLLDEGWEARTVRWLLVAADRVPTHGVDVSGEPLERGIASLEAHRAYLADIPDHPVPRKFLPEVTQLAGRALGVAHAVLFRVHDLKPDPPAEG